MAKKIIWLEDEPATIDHDFVAPLERRYDFLEVEICQNYSSFFSEIVISESEGYEILFFIIDIRMLLGVGQGSMECFGKNIPVENDLEAGLEFYTKCLKHNYPNVEVLFITSKPKEHLKKDLEKFKISKDIKVYSKDEYEEFLDYIKGVCDEKCS